MSGEVRKILDEKAAVPLWPVAGGLLLAKLKSFALVGLNGFRLLGCANSSASTGRRRDRFPADAHMLALRRAVRAQATSWPQQRQAARDVWSARLSPWRTLLHTDLSQSCFQSPTTFFNRC